MRPTYIGKMLLSLANVITVIAPFMADWNDTHLLNERWTPHARFHGAVSLGTASSLSLIALWLLWRPSSDQDAAVTTAAMVPISYWGSFFPALLVPGAAPEDPGNQLPRIAGIPINICAAGVTALTAGLGWFLDRRLRPRKVDAH
jgi:hypothetical protein